MNPGFRIIEKEIREKISDELDRLGLLYRIFSRSKDEISILEKIERKEKEGGNYSQEGKKIQDLIGIRIVTYFSDDVLIVKEILSNKLNFIDTKIDEIELTVFKPKRTNIICSFNEKQSEILREIQAISHKKYLLLIDNTFELQLRTMLSEGWHEIDHSLRYKCKDDWLDFKESERLLNGIYASLETNDIALKNLFNELSYNHFKNKNWEALIRTKFRLKFQLKELSNDLINILNNDPNLAKRLTKLNRNHILLKLSKLDISLPINFNNLLMLINHIEFQDKKIYEITPDEIKKTHNKM